MAKICVAYSAFYSSFKRFIPGLEILKKPEDATNYDLIIFTGGEDINPSRYGQQEQYSLGSSPERDEFEMRTFNYAFRNGVRIYGSCRGLQLINVALGGTLIQDLGLAGKGHFGTHDLTWTTEKKSILKDLFPGKVNSLHHQGIENLGRDLRSLAEFNGVPEIIYGKRILATQFHPEMMSGTTDFFNYLVKWASVEDSAETKTTAEKVEKAA